MCKLLVAEDEPAVALHLQSILEEAGRQVVGVAQEASQAIDIANVERPHVVLVDIWLRGRLDGLSLATCLSQQFGCRIIFLTADPLYVCRQSWPLEHQLIAKPFSERDVLKAVAAECMHVNAGVRRHVEEFPELIRSVWA
jgi:CheY-like chemotaxis protein